jgi:hypothetical protein
MKTKLIVFSPNRKSGGSNLLLARTAANLERRHGINLVLVDFEDGATRAAWLAEGVPFEFRPYEVGRSVEIDRADALLAVLLGTKKFPSMLKGGNRIRFLAWCTAPQDPFKFIPPSHFFNAWGWRSKKAVLSTLFRAHSRRISVFLREGSSRGGVLFIDEHCHAVNQRLFGPGIPCSLVPICTSLPSRAPRSHYKASGKAYWVGRVTDFKTESLVAVARGLLVEGSPVNEVVIIGDGADTEKAKARLAGLPVRWLGYIPPAELDAEIYANADMVFGHATALLEAAKLGIPSLLVDGTYDQIPKQMVKVEWLHKCPVGYMGNIVKPAEFLGRPILDCLRDYAADAPGIGRADFFHWQETHHPDAVADKLAHMISHGDYTYDDFLKSGAAIPGHFGAILEWIKLRVFRRRY